MKVSNPIILTAVAIISFAIFILIIQLALRKLKKSAEAENHFKNSYGIWFSTLLFSASIITGKSISLLSEAINNINKMLPDNIPKEIAKTASLFIGFSAIWFLLWFVVVNYLSIAIVGKRVDQNEMDIDNWPYFLIKGSLLIGVVMSLSTVFEILLRVFIPNIEIPFYH